MAKIIVLACLALSLLCLADAFLPMVPYNVGNTEAHPKAADELKTGYNLRQAYFLKNHVLGEVSRPFVLLFLDNHTSRQGFRATLYLAGMLYTFLGVSIAADVFMASIERITSQVWRRKIKDPVTGKPETQEITVWNPTVANLSLLALGSSAPEILLSIIELCGNRFYSGQLGPSTIVGSAAFNLFIITGICVSSVPKHDIRAIEQRLVFAVTNITAIMAYLWLLFILRVTSPNQIDIWEALTTFFMFPILVVMAYLADRQFCCRKRRLGVYDGEENEVVAERGNRKVLAKDLRALARANPTLTSEQLASVMAQRLHQMTRHNRAYYRAQATNWLSNVRTMDYANPNELEDGNDTTCEDLERRGKCQIEFGADQFGVNEVDKYAELTLVRCGKLNKEASIRILTIEHSAKEGRDFKNFDKILTFNRGETEVEASIRVFENKKIKRDLSFEVRIERLPREDYVELGRQVSATVLVVDQGKSNTIQFERKKYAVSETVAWGRFAVVRSGHFKERVSVDWDASDETAKNGFDYVTEGGSITFESGQVRKFIQVRILDDTEIEGNETFKLMLKKIHGKNTKLGDNKTATVTILDDDVIQQNAKEAESLINDQTSSMSAIGATSWKDQFVVLLPLARAGTIEIASSVSCGPGEMVIELSPTAVFKDIWDEDRNVSIKSEKDGCFDPINADGPMNLTFKFDAADEECVTTTEVIPFYYLVTATFIARPADTPAGNGTDNSTDVSWKFNIICKYPLKHNYTHLGGIDVVQEDSQQQIDTGGSGKHEVTFDSGFEGSNGTDVKEAAYGEKTKFNLELKDRTYYAYVCNATIDRYILASYKAIQPDICKFSKFPTFNPNNDFTSEIVFVSGGCPQDIDLGGSRMVKAAAGKYAIEFEAFHFRDSNNLFIHCLVHLCLDEKDCDNSCWTFTPAATTPTPAATTASTRRRRAVASDRVVMTKSLRVVDAHEPLTPAKQSYNPSTYNALVVLAPAKQSYNPSTYNALVVLAITVGVLTVVGAAVISGALAHKKRRAKCHESTGSVSSLRPLTLPRVNPGSRIVYH